MADAPRWPVVARLALLGLALWSFLLWPGRAPPAFLGVARVASKGGSALQRQRGTSIPAAALASASAQFPAAAFSPEEDDVWDWEAEDEEEDEEGDFGEGEEEQEDEAESESEAELVAEAGRQLQELERLAATGDPDGLFRLGRVLRRGGQWVTPDPERAFGLLSAAAEVDHPKAQLLVGMMLWEGEGTEADEHTAMLYYTMAAENGVSEAQYRAGCMHYEGLFDDMGEPDTLSAAYWWKQAAEQGHADAQYRLGGMLLADEGLKRNVTWAAEFFRKSAEQDHARAAEAIGLMYRLGMGVERDAREAVRWLAKAGVAGDANACFAMGEMYREGEGVEKDAIAALRWFTRAGDRGHLKAAEELGVMYLTGEGTEVNEEGSAYWFLKAEQLQKGGKTDLEDAMWEDDDEEDDGYENRLDPEIEKRLPAWAK